MTIKLGHLNTNDASVLSTLDASGKPLSAYDILDRARSGALKAPVQVYRSLQKLEASGLVHRIEALNAFVACSEHSESCAGSDHVHSHHKPGFVICSSCGQVREFEDDRFTALAMSAAGPDFAIEAVSLEVYGRCNACQVAGGERA